LVERLKERYKPKTGNQYKSASSENHTEQKRPHDKVMETLSVSTNFVSMANLYNNLTSEQKHEVITWFKSQNLDTGKDPSQKDLSDYMKKISDLENDLKNKNNAVTTATQTIEHWKEQAQYKKELEDQLREANTKLQLLQVKDSELQDKEQRIKETLIQLNELEMKKQEFFSDADNLKKVSDVYVKSRDFFQKEVFYIAALELREGTKKAMQKEVRELIEMVESWKNAIETKFFGNDFLMIEEGK
jgi:vacuolar-type H+-ATPase subunit I/STV1